MRRGKHGLLAKASTSPEGENPTAWTHPPAGDEYSPQMVLNGNFDPQTLGAGLGANMSERYSKLLLFCLPFINFLDVA